MMVMDLAQYQLGSSVQVPRGAHLFRTQDEVCGDLHFVRSGHLKLYQPCGDGVQRIIDFVRPGDWLGIDSIGEQRRHASALALTDCQVDVVQYRQLAELMDEEPYSCDLFSAMLSREIDRQQLAAAILRSAGACQRIVMFLLQRAGPAPQAPSPEMHSPLPMSRQDISDYLGLTPATVSRTLSALKRNGWISLGQRGFVVLSRSALEQVACGSPVSIIQHAA
ncbi:Crp/Fnr family transcriptional regulator [Duganella sp. HH101]|uniref:Crp/Fnr family transcriptional regulator n=1 Tax=Duganella sp. HH101 TaxID=1781066 RepID=UPI00087550B6|nr:Crp/Fnr family transcriptional regulator [Duganella sp. HH101]OFA06739.1 nitrogen fixation regulation protein FixK [Duganella sp. HH101]